MSRTDAQKRAAKDHQARKTKNLAIRFCPTDMAMLDYVKSQGNMAAHIKGLIAADMISKRLEVPERFRKDNRFGS